MSRGGTPVEPVDLRLLPAAAAAWAAATVVVVAPARFSLTAAVLAVVLAGVLFRRTADGTAALMLVGVAATLVAGGAQVAGRTAGGLAELATDRPVVHVSGRLREPPRQVGAGAAGEVRAVLQIAGVRTRGSWFDVSVPVAVVADASWLGLPSGVVVEASGRLAPSRPGDRAVAALSAGAPTVRDDRPGVELALARVRSGLLGVAARLPGDAGSLLPGMAIGDTRVVPADLSSAMRGAGLTHLVAVSGAHFVLITAAVLALATAVGLRRRARVVPVVLAAAAFVALVQPGPSVLRAALMGAVSAAGLLAGRPSRVLPALAACVLTLLVVDPWLAREVGFALSVLATAGLALVGGPLADRWVPGSSLARTAAAALAAQLACAPVLLLITPTVAPYAVVANIAAAPAVAPATVLGLLAAVVSPCWADGAALAGTLAGACCWWIGAVARTVARLPGAQAAWLDGPAGVLLASVTAIAAAVLLLTPRRSDHARWNRARRRGRRSRVAG